MFWRMWQDQSAVERPTQLDHADLQNVCSYEKTYAQRRVKLSSKDEDGRFRVWKRKATVLELTRRRRMSYFREDEDD